MTNGKQITEIRFFKNGATVKIVIAVISAILIYSAFIHARVSKVVNLALGQMSPADIYSTADFRFIDDDMTVIAREKAANDVVPVYGIDKNMIEDNVKKITKFLNDISGIAKDQNISFDEKLKKAKEVSLGKISDEDLAVLLVSEIDNKAIENILELYNRIMKNGVVHQSDKIKMFQDIGDKVNIIDLSSGSVESRPINSILSLEEIGDYTYWQAKDFFTNHRFINCITNNLMNYVGVNLVFDKNKTDELKKSAMSAIKSEYGYAKKGQIIIRKGEEVAKRHLAQIKSLYEAEAKSQSKEEKWYYRLGMMLIIVLVMTFFADYLKNREPLIFMDNSKILMIAALFVGALWISKLVLYFNSHFEITWMKYIILIPFASIMLAILVNQRIAFILSLALSIFLGIMNANRLDFAILALIGGIAGIVFAGSAKHRWELMRIGLIVSIVNIILILSFQLIKDFDLYVFFLHALSGFASGVLCALFAAFFIPVFEYFFNIATDMKLLEFLDLNHPMLKKMVIEAPGTYHHSLMVGNLAEAAASAIGANPLLAKVAAYFHDIGKLLKPEYFSENEEYGKSFHKGLNPSMSSLIILSHVKDGVDLAKKYKLPDVIVDILKEHHGTSLVYYFYKKAEKTAAEGGNTVEEDNYRYKGPGPRSKESGIVLIADVVEAASRSLEKPTPSRIENLVKEIISDKINDEQLNECELTFSEIGIITEVFERVLIAAYHSRIRYPKDEENADTGEGTETAADRSG